VEIAAKIHEPSMQFPQYNCMVLYPRVSSLYETDLRVANLGDFLPKKQILGFFRPLSGLLKC
jgi:hypothetical protein